MQHLLVGYTNVTYNSHPPFVRPHLEDKHNNIWMVRGGADYHLINELSRKYNFTYEFIYMHNQYELLIKDFDRSTIDPSIHLSLAHNKTIDIGVGGWTLTYERAQTVEHLYPYLVEQTSIMTAVPKRHIPNPGQLFEPFDSFIWMGVFGSLILFFLLGRFGRRFKRRHQDRSSLLWINVQLLFRQPVNSLCKESPETSDVLFVSSLWMLIVMVLSSAYAGCLFSIMTVPHVNTIDTINELAQHCNQGSIIVLVENGTASMSEIQTSRRPLAIMIKKQLQVVQYQLWAAEMILNSSIENGGHRYAFIQQYSMLKHLQMIYGSDQLYLPKPGDESSLIKTFNAVLLRPSFPLARQFDRINARLFYAGLYQLWLEREFLQNKSISQSIINSVSNDNDNNENLGKETENPKETHINHVSADDHNNNRIQVLSMKQLTIFFYLYLCLMFICCMMFVAERIYYMNNIP
ncbi:hypothetical protein BLA29_004081 [Euroglyphus maynei]|uniref:Ionotropic glutamate receptor C-terminal domain-containing protein n=1 Tax=Euroglyphus maynei TaxID=6958 RepID=A0A1Y3ALZ0_EURMA|nr:hypothetical protein BLA29_004081 [Euroglyphus maynei]